MIANKVVVNDQLLRQRCVEFLRSPAASQLLQELDIPLWMCFLSMGFCMLAGTIMLPTIVWTLDGLRLWWSVLTLEPFKAIRQNYRRHPEQLIPLLGHAVIVGPDRRHGLVLGTFKTAGECSPDWLAYKAAYFANLYVRGPKDQSEQPLYSLLRDDMYHPDRRRRVPEPFAEGAEIWLFDVVLFEFVRAVFNVEFSPQGNPIFAFVAEPGAKGAIIQIPWRAIQDAVHVADS